MNWFKHAKSVLNSTFGFSFTDETTEAEFIDQLEAQAKERNEASESRMSEIDERIEALQDNLNTIEGTLAGLTESLNGVNASIKELQKAQSEFASVNESIETINGRIDDIAKEKASNSIKTVKTANGQVAEKGETQKAIEDAKANGKVEVVFKKPVK